MTQRGEGGVGSMGGLLDRIHVEEVECIGIRLEPRDSLKALGFKAKCYCWVMGPPSGRTQHK